MQELNSEESERYHRQILFWGEEGQKTLKNKTVLIVGAGGLGSPVIYYLSAAGIGNLKICDGDTLCLSNLNRQILHGQDRIGVNKAISAAQTIKNFNPQVNLEVIDKRLTPDDVEEIARGCDLAIEVTDSAESKKILNESFVSMGIDSIYGFLLGLGGVCFLHNENGPCWNCLFNSPPKFPSGLALPFDYYPSMGAAAGFLGGFIANIAIRFLLGEDKPIVDKIFYTSQLYPSKKLMLSARGLKTVMTSHFKRSFPKNKCRFPETDNFFNEHTVHRDISCRICGQNTENDGEK